MEKNTSLKDIDFEFYVHHYLSLAWRWKWFIILAVPLSAFITFMAVTHFGLVNSPPLTATVLIGLDNKSSQNDWIDFVDSYQNKERLLLNRNFLEKVVQNMSLQLVVSKYSRYDIFDSVHVEQAAPTGNFLFEIDNNNKDLFRIKYSNSQLKIKNKVVEIGVLSSLSSVSISGISLHFSKAFLLNPHHFSFSIYPMRATIDNILSRFKVTSPNPRDQKYYFTATLQGTDYPLIAQTVNTIADMFIDINLSLKQNRVNEALSGLSKQLKTAEMQLAKSKEELKIFLSNNPTIGLSQTTQMIMSELLNLETGSMQVNNVIDQANELQMRLLNAVNDDLVRVISEAIVFLQAQGSLSATSLQLSLNQHFEEKRNIVGNYDKSHPIFKEMDLKFSNLRDKTVQSVNALISQLKKSIIDRNSSINKIASRLQNIPSKELQLAELQRRQEIDSEIYTTLLSKYNEIKVAQSVQKADVFIMDYAVQPIPPSPINQLTNVALIILSSVILMTFGPPFLVDKLDKTARTEQSLRKLLPYRFLITIPRMKILKSPFSKSTSIDNNNNSSHATPRQSNLLITDPKMIHPSFCPELFRSLNTKIQLDLYDDANKSIAITSLDMSDGKSTITSNLAIAIADNGIKTILIDCDMRKGVCSKLFNLPNSAGLSDYLISALNNNQQSLPNVPLQRTNNPNLWVLSSGTAVENPQKLILSTPMLLLKRKLQQQPFFIIFDSPPIGIASDAALLNNLVSKYIVVVKSGTTDTCKLHKVISKDYPVIDKKILGVVLNMGETVDQKKYYRYY